MAEGNSPGTVSTTNSTEADLDRVCEETDKMTTELSAGDAALERFLQQQRSDLMYELRRIQHGERPVTGQSHRENIASFMAKHVQDPEGASGKNVPANVDAVEEHRPEAVVVEVQGVVEQRRVSSMLQSQQFRRHLENIIRGSISSVRQSVSASRSRASSSPQPAIPASSSPQPATPASNSPQPPQLPAASRNRPSVQSNASRNLEGVRVPSVQPQVRDAQPQPNSQRSMQDAVDSAPAGEEAVTERGLWDTISQVQHEEMVYEISDLLHRRLVSSALGSEFRTVMELHVQEHLSNTQTDGEAVANYISNIRQSQAHVPNDFRHMGIMPGPRDDGSDNISITGISATSVPYTQTNRHMNRELQSLKSQMEEMKNMLRLSFDLQMDIQRAIRQEVAAAIASATAQGAMAAAAAPAVQSRPVNDAHCLICLENHSDSVLYQCGHICVCFTCGKNLMSRGNGKCPVCRAPIRDIIRAYKSNVE